MVLINIFLELQRKQPTQFYVTAEFDFHHTMPQRSNELFQFSKVTHIEVKLLIKDFENKTGDIESIPTFIYKNCSPYFKAVCLSHK